MITLVLTNRDRDLRIVQKCLKSLSLQSNKEFKVFLIDYGSEEDYIAKLKELIQEFTFVELIICPVKGQLWNKSRAINIILRKTISPYFLVGDIDLMFHPDFIQIAKELANPNEVHYFQYGFLSLKESLKEKEFDAFEVDFKGSNEVTGTTLFPTELLKSVNGYDEFYHGWGAEDTDIHLRLQHIGFSIIFNDAKILLKHQWHPKIYRSKNSNNPFHSSLERINQSYMHFSNQSRRSKVNIHSEWGILPLESDRQKILNEVTDHKFVLDSEDIKLSAVLKQLQNFTNETVEIIIRSVTIKERLKQSIKKFLGKKSKTYLDLQTVNDRILEEIVLLYRNKPYSYSFQRKNSLIQLKIKF